MTRKRSRLYRQLERENRKNLFLSIFGIIILLFVLLKFGLPSLVSFSLFVSGTKQTPQILQNSTEFVMPPQLNSLPSATKSANFELSGKALPNSIVDLYLNDNLLDKMQADKNGNFSFKSIYVKGDNKIYAKATLKNKTSNASDAISVFFKDTPPALTVNSPLDGQQFAKDQNVINVSGATDSGVKVTVNGFWAIVDQGNNFNYQLKLQNGDNTIKVEAIDQAGNTTDKQLKVKYSS